MTEEKDPRDLNEDFNCCNCGVPVETRVLFCSDECSGKFPEIPTVNVVPPNAFDLIMGNIYVDPACMQMETKCNAKGYQFQQEDDGDVE